MNTRTPHPRLLAPMAAAVAVTILLGGCIDDQKRQFARCTAEGLRAHPKDQYERNPFIMACMDIAGYARNLRDPRCNMNWLGETNPYCYVPKDSAARLIYRIETRFDGGQG